MHVNKSNVPVKLTFYLFKVIREVINVTREEPHYFTYILFHFLSLECTMFIKLHAVAVVVFIMFNNKSGSNGPPNVSPSRLWCLCFHANELHQNSDVSS